MLDSGLGTKCPDEEGGVGAHKKRRTRRTPGDGAGMTPLRPWNPVEN